MTVNIVNLKEKADLITELHEYRCVAQMNQIQFKLVKAHREFIWHKHPDTDEAFMAIEGKFRIHLRDQVLHLGPGELVVIPKNVEHKPVFEECCTLMLIEPEGTVNTGDAGGDLTDTRVEEI